MYGNFVIPLAILILESSQRFREAATYSFQSRLGNKIRFHIKWPSELAHNSCIDTQRPIYQA